MLESLKPFSEFVFKVSVLFVLLFVILPILVSAQSQTSQEIVVTGEVNASETPSGTYDTVFRLYAMPAGGAPVWEGYYTHENNNPVSIEDGFFTVRLGSGKGNALSVPLDNNIYYLGIEIEGKTEAPERIRIDTSAYTRTEITTSQRATPSNSIFMEWVVCPVANLLQNPFGWCAEKSGSLPDARVALYVPTNTKKASRTQTSEMTSASNSTTEALAGKYTKKSPTIINKYITYQTNGTLQDSSLLKRLAALEERSVLPKTPPTQTQSSVDKTFTRTQTNIIYDSTRDSISEVTSGGTLTDATLANSVTFPGLSSRSLLYLDTNDILTAATGLSIINNSLAIGTTTAYEKLTVDGPVYLANSSPATTANRLYANGSALYWNGSVVTSSSTGNWSGNGADVYRASGNVGIGTTSPSSKLQVQGDLYVTGAFKDSTNSAGTSGYVLQTTNTGTAWVATSTLGFGNGSVTSIALSAPAGFSVSGSPITTSGTLALSYAAGYEGLKTASSSNWNTFYNTPSTQITAGTNIAWTNNTLNVSGLGDGTFLGLSDTQSAYTANRVLFTNAGGTALTDASGFTFSGMELSVDGSINIAANNLGYEIGGNRVLYSSSTNSSTLVGIGAGASLLSDGLYNTAIGRLALNTATSTDFNTAIGYGAGNGGSTDNASFTAVGYNAGNNMTGGSSAVVMGRQAGANATAAGRLTAIGYQAAQGNAGTRSTAVGYQSLYNNSGTFTTGIGEFAGLNNTGATSVFIGNSAGSGNTGATVTLVGVSAGQNNTGNNLVALGNAAGINNTGASLTAIGHQTLRYTNAANSVALGYQAGYGNNAQRKDISNSLFLGYRAGYTIATSSNNILIGFQAGDSLTTGSNNLIIGYDVEAPSNTASNQLNIGNLIFGTGIDGVGTTLSSGNIGIGDTTPTHKLDVAGDINISDTTTGYKIGDSLVLYASSTNFSTLSGIGAGQALLSDGLYNTANGYQALYNATSSDRNTAVGYRALFNTTTGYNNSAQGFAALYKNTTGYGNAAQGVSSLYSNTTGYNNSAQGFAALYNNTTGYNNSAQGFNALYNNTTGSNNSAQGINSLLSNTTGAQNSAQGFGSLFSNTTGSYNIGAGFGAGRYLTDGSSPASTTDYSIFLGANTKALTANDQNSIVIGYNANGLGSNTVVLGNDSITTTALKGNVGIGTTLPGQRLEVYDSANVDVFTVTGLMSVADTSGASIGFRNLYSSGTGYIAKIGVETGATVDRGSLVFSTAPTSNIPSERLRITSTGNVGIGTTTPSAKLQVQGNGKFVKDGVYNSGAQLTLQGATNPNNRMYLGYDTTSNYGYIQPITEGTAYRDLILNQLGGNVGIGTTTITRKLTVAGDIRTGTSGTNGCIERFDGGVLAGTCVSDENLKTNIVPLGGVDRNILAHLVALVPVTYNWNQEANDIYAKGLTTTNTGLIAQNVEANFPELVTENKDGYKQVDFSAFPYYIIQAVKDLWEIVTGNTNKIDTLEERIKALEDAVDTNSSPFGNSGGQSEGGQSDNSENSATSTEGSDVGGSETTENSTSTEELSSNSSESTVSTTSTATSSDAAAQDVVVTVDTTDTTSSTEIQQEDVVEDNTVAENNSTNQGILSDTGSETAPVVDGNSTTDTSEVVVDVTEPVVPSVVSSAPSSGTSSEIAP